MLRLIKNNFCGHELSIAAVSIYHGLIALGSSSSACRSIFLWDYEFCKLLLEIKLPGDSEPTSLAFINGYGLLAVGTSEGTVHVLRVKNLAQSSSNKGSSSLSSYSHSSSHSYAACLVAQFQPARRLRKTNET